MFKKFLAMTLVAGLCISLAACGKNTDDKKSTTDGTEISNTTPEKSTEPDTTVPSESDDEDDKNNEQDSPSLTDTIGNTLKNAFLDMTEENPQMTAQEIADAILENPVIDFGGATMPVEEGLLNGFDNAEITGFSEGVMFAPMIGSIPFVGYVFELSDDADADNFTALLKDSANPRWNICTEADETVVERADTKVFFLMCPYSFEDEDF